MDQKPDVSSGATETPWLALEHKDFTRLTSDLDVDVAIIGGGITGLSIAYHLSQEGRKVAVLEDGHIGSGETGRTTAHLASALDDRFFRLEKLHGAQGALLAYRSHEAAIAEIARIVRAEAIGCDFERLPGYLFAADGDPTTVLEDELNAAKRIGIRGVSKLSQAPIPSFYTGPCLRFGGQGQFHPMKYLVGLAAAVVRHEGRIFEHSHVGDYVEEDGRWMLKVVDGGRVRAGAMVIATNAPIVSLVKLPLKQYAYRTYAISLKLQKDSIPKGLYWDTASPYHYVRLSEDQLIVGGEDHKTGQPDYDRGLEPYIRLEGWARKRFDETGDVVDRWSGQILEPADGLAFIGRYPGVGRNVFVATGDSGHGMTHATIAGMLIRDLIIGHENPWETLYDPMRKTLRSVGELIRENLNVVPQYGKWLTAGDGGTAREIQPGEGRVLRKGLKKIAVCRNERGELCTMSAVCPHLGGIVTWNAAEKTWDCPCHGSRFSAEGEVLNGPANTGLEKIRMPSKSENVKSRKR